MRQHAQSINKLSSNSIVDYSASGTSSGISTAPPSAMYSYHPKYGFREKKQPTRPVQGDVESPRVSVTVNKNIMDVLSKEIGTTRVGVVLGILLQDWVTEKRKTQ